MLCCIDKTMTGWNLERVASICRERCGGQGYISANKFGDYLAIAHAGLTAEGDNRVLMVKICKDMITNVTKKGQKLPQMKTCPYRHIAKQNSICTPDLLLDLLKFRETLLYGQLTDDIKSKTPKVGAYNVLMRETSEVMQALALVYGERSTFEYCLAQLPQMSSGNRDVMLKVFTLYAADCVYRDMGDYMIKGVISAEAAKDLTA